jgi:ABC-type antimicrobial peptide transport system permease subunit
MEPNLTIQTAVVLFAISAVGGITMAAIRFSGKPYPPTWLAMLHGFLSAAALTLLIYAAFTVGLPTLALTATVLFVIAAIGGVTMNLNFHWKALPLPKWLVLVHAAIAVVGFVCLLCAAWATFSHATS